MTFASPIWLIGLLPWGGLAAYLFRGAGHRAAVPFLQLWPRPAVSRSNPRFRLPQAHVLLMCLAALLAILAAAGPRWTSGNRAAGPLSIIIDRGITMSGDQRYFGLLDRCSALIGPRVAVTLISTPGLFKTGRSTAVTEGSWIETAKRIPPAAIDTSDQLKITVADQLRQTSGPVIVLTDQPIDWTDARVVVIAPDRPLRNIGITAFAATSKPRPQVMVRLENRSADQAADQLVHLRVQSGANSAERNVTFTANSATEFIDLPTLGDVITAEIDMKDDIPADDAAWLVRQSAGVTLDIAADVPAEVQRMATVFARHRPAGRHVLLTDHDLPTGVDGIDIVPTGSENQSIVPLTSINSPLTAGVTAWPGPAANVKPPAGFGVALQRDGVALLAMHETSPRQIWVNLNLNTWSKTTDFVVFFSNLFDSFRGGDSDEFVSFAPQSLSTDWKRIDDRKSPVDVVPGLWPGLYRSEDGRLLAINSSTAGKSRFGSRETSRPLDGFAAMPSGISAAPFLCWMAVFVMGLSALFWPRKSTSSPVSF